MFKISYWNQHIKKEAKEYIDLGYESRKIKGEIFRREFALKNARLGGVPEDLLKETEKEVESLREELKPLEQRMKELEEEMARKNEAFFKKQKQQKEE